MMRLKRDDERSKAPRCFRRIAKDVELSHSPASQVFTEHAAFADTCVVNPDRFGVFLGPAPTARINRHWIGNLPEVASDDPKRASATRIREGDAQAYFGGVIQSDPSRPRLLDKRTIDLDAHLYFAHDPLYPVVASLAILPG